MFQIPLNFRGNSLDISYMFEGTDFMDFGENVYKLHLAEVPLLKGIV